MLVTAIKPHKKGKNRLHLFLDGKLTLDLSPIVLEEAGVRAGQDLSSSEVERLKKADQNQRAMERARRYLVHRPRSEFEVRTSLERYGFENDVVTRTLDRLRRDGLVDDEAFAAFWKQNRMEFSSRSSRLMAQELKQKGIDPEIIEATIAGIDDEGEAYRAGLRKAHSLRTADFYEFRRKLGAFLHRRGFNYEAIGSIVDRLWQEKTSEGENG
jgi:regulatory protein